MPRYCRICKLMLISQKAKPTVTQSFTGITTTDNAALTAAITGNMA
ncbi:unknown [Prevotella sp. CAG:1185]|nr:unknown [Prevotella sp. CAG:1185]